MIQIDITIFRFRLSLVLFVIVFHIFGESDILLLCTRIKFFLPDSERLEYWQNFRFSITRDELLHFCRTGIWKTRYHRSARQPDEGWTSESTLPSASGGKNDKFVSCTRQSKKWKSWVDKGGRDNIRTKIFYKSNNKENIINQHRPHILGQKSPAVWKVNGDWQVFGKWMEWVLIPSVYWAEKQ